ncbi:MAG TPA: TauD/TfdA family dioxygenase, partial [bacterium]|nr:TauD/TfdA family dioxygenase [bacterium]
MRSAPYLDLQHLQSPMLAQAVQDHRAWTRATLGPGEWSVPFSADCLAEVEALLVQVARDPLPLLLLEPGQFKLAACRAALNQVRQRLHGGIGLAVLDRLPVERWSREQIDRVYWVLGRCLAPLVAQKWDGTMVYEVRDTGRSFGYGVRASWTNVELFFHTDNCFAVAPPDYVSLLCLQPAQSGGISRFCSLYTVHNRMLERHPRLLARLYRPAFYDRQAEHGPEDPKVAWAPTFAFDGKMLRARLSIGLVRRGYELMDRQMDAELAEALEALDQIMRDESLWVEFVIEKGQIQYLNNWELAHFRSQFQDAEDPALKRHLIRVWYRESGRPFYIG